MKLTREGKTTWYGEDHTYADTNEHEEPFTDAVSGNVMTTVGVHLLAPASNTGNVSYGFVTGKYGVLEPGNYVCLTGVAARSIFIKLATANDHLQVAAW